MQIKFCDEVDVFHESAVIQQGSHASLVTDTNGKYYELWNALGSIIRKQLDALNKIKSYNGDLADCQVAIISAYALNRKFKIL